MFEKFNCNAYTVGPRSLHTPGKFNEKCSLAKHHKIYYIFRNISATMKNLVSNKRAYQVLSFEWHANGTEVFLGVIFFVQNLISFLVKTFQNIIS